MDVGLYLAGEEEWEPQENEWRSRNICLARMLQDAAGAFPVDTLDLDKQKRYQEATKTVCASCILHMPEAAQEAKRCYQKWHFFFVNTITNMKCS